MEEKNCNYPLTEIQCFQFKLVRIMYLFKFISHNEYINLLFSTIKTIFFSQSVKLGSRPKFLPQLHPTGAFLRIASCPSKDATPSHAAQHLKFWTLSLKVQRSICQVSGTKSNGMDLFCCKLPVLYQLDFKLHLTHPMFWLGWNWNQRVLIQYFASNQFMNLSKNKYLIFLNVTTTVS